MMSLYVSGPMTGRPNMNFEAFNDLTCRLRWLGYTVTNPVEINPDPSADWLDCIAADIAAMRYVDGIVQMPGWETSFGAWIEYLVALKYGLDVYCVADSRIGYIKKTASHPLSIWSSISYAGALLALRCFKTKRAKYREAV
ncbi:hypothetical protein DM48_339 [Burkholderia gladioli]|uniref:Nucleoside 2-deoxyribosyltransferase n=1 Tax=Burkholderia gladioli TaxID=28095 RepID=A0AAW3F012_BURGA|nr:DUF4406 domain-containing protein [Burkholderia gladioli]KGC13718.1 hypothetical protein DM48_339 [Burkholderia gladioli]